MAGSGLSLDTRDPRPLWRQIEEGIERLVATRALGAGDAVPSVRELAVELRVNPATVAKAFQRLVDHGVLETRRGAGTFVVERPPRLSSGERRALLVDAAARLASVAGVLDAQPEEAHAALDEAIRNLRSEAEENR